MGPRKKLKMSSSAKKSTVKAAGGGSHKYGIQHFFDRHFSSSQPPSDSDTHPHNPHPLIPPLPNPTHSSGVIVDADADDQFPQLSVSASLLHQQQPPRCAFSPGMLIKQSQDDGIVDEVTWKISPVNQRLHSLQHSSSPIRPCSLSSLYNTHQLLPSQTAAAFTIRPPTADSVATQPSPFTTPPSLSYSHSRLATVQPNDASDQLGLTHHKKALIELLDQVEDALSCQDPESSDIKAHPSQVLLANGNDTTLRPHPFIKKATCPLKKVTGSLANQYFLVLEVSEKHMPATSSQAQGPFKVLRLLDEQTGQEHTVCLWEEWFYTDIAPGDTVNVIGEFDDQGKCDVDSLNNLLIVHPDILVSGTRVAASCSCPRRSVLDERLKCNENSTATLIGTLLHQVFQAGLIKENPTLEFLEDFAGVVLHKHIESLYASGVHENDMMKTLVEAIPKILNWITLFKYSMDSGEPFVDFGSDYGLKRLKISEVIDIEEMAWAPKYGLKGMIDASIRVRMETSGNELDEKILPLEFKTGKVGQSSMEHCAQVILYTLLLSERYLKHIDSGLLCYLQSDQTQGIVVRRSDVVGLIMRRNKLASDILRASTTQLLPPMLRSPAMCRGCRHIGACSIYHKVHGGNTESSGLGDVFDSNVQHLTSGHCAFLQHWEQLIDLEAKEAQLVKNEIWHSHNLRGDCSASCLTSIVLDTSTRPSHERSAKGHNYIYRFVQQKLPPMHLLTSDGHSFVAPSSSTNELDCKLKSGDYVILSTESGHQNIARGVVTDISHSHVSVSFSKRLRLPGNDSLLESNDLSNEVWRIDKDEVMTSFSMMRSNLVQLFLPSPQSSHLRKMIVDLEAPRFDSGCLFSQDPAISYIWSVKSLNADQRRSILKILTAKDYALILGMPGTGKTSTMVHVVKALLIRGASILLTSYTNSAVDNLLIKLKAQGIDFVRIGRHEAIHEEIQAHCFSAMEVHSVDDIRLRLDQVKVVAVTCLGVSCPLLANKTFNVCIMDEAGQITLPISLGPLMHASMFVLVGDHYQLPPLVQSTEARENGMGVSLFCRLSEAHPQSISALQSQYRMCQGIMELSNALIYGDRLRCGSSEIANAKLRYSSSEFSSLWLEEVLSPSRPVVFINTDMLPALEAKESKTVNNPVEAYLVAEVARELIKSGIEGEDIGIITPYNSQANLIRTALYMTSVEIHTIDKYQGRDKDCILVSFVRSSENPRNCISSLLGDWHRINVALTRAKKKLIMVGSTNTLSKVPLLKLLLNKVDEQSGVFNVSKDDIHYKTGKGLLHLKSVDRRQKFCQIEWAHEVGLALEEGTPSSLAHSQEN